MHTESPLVLVPDHIFLVFLSGSSKFSDISGLPSFLVLPALYLLWIEFCLILNFINVMTVYIFFYSALCLCGSSSAVDSFSTAAFYCVNKSHFMHLFFPHWAFELFPVFMWNFYIFKNTAHIKTFCVLNLTNYNPYLK